MGATDWFHSSRRDFMEHESGYKSRRSVSIGPRTFGGAVRMERRLRATWRRSSRRTNVGDIGGRARGGAVEAAEALAMLTVDTRAQRSYRRNALI
jgi:hypothetical protein